MNAPNIAPLELEALRRLLDQKLDRETALSALVVFASDTAIPFPLRLMIFDAMEVLEGGHPVEGALARLRQATGIEL